MPALARAACSIARSYRNLSHSVFTFRGAPHHSRRQCTLRSEVVIRSAILGISRIEQRGIYAPELVVHSKKVSWLRWGKVIGIDPHRCFAMKFELPRPISGGRYFLRDLLTTIAIAYRFQSHSAFPFEEWLVNSQCSCGFPSGRPNRGEHEHV
jgi:hypothetical protein